MALDFFLTVANRVVTTYHDEEMFWQPGKLPSITKLAGVLTHASNNRRLGPAYHCTGERGLAIP